MKNLSIGLSALALIAILTMPSLSDVFRGRIKTIDAKSGSVILTEGQKHHHFTLNGDSKILNVKGEPLSGGLESAALREGRRVTVNYSAKDGKKVLERLQLRP